MGEVFLSNYELWNLHVLQKKQNKTNRQMKCFVWGFLDSAVWTLMEKNAELNTVPGLMLLTYPHVLLNTAALGTADSIDLLLFQEFSDQSCLPIAIATIHGYYIHTYAVRILDRIRI